MADNTQLSVAVGVGDVMRTEDVGGAKIPACKLYGGVHGVDGGVIGIAGAPLVVSPGASTFYVPAPGSLASGAAKSSPGNLKSFAAVNRNVSARYLQLFNLVSAPGGGAAALVEFLVPPGFMTVLGTDFFTDAGVAFSVGIAWGFSSTPVTFAAGTAADHDLTMVVV